MLARRYRIPARPTGRPGATDRSAWRRFIWLGGLALVTVGLFTPTTSSWAADGATAPTSRLGKDFAAWIELLNEASEDEIRAYVEDRFAPDFLAQFPVDTLVAFHVQLRDQSGRLTVWPPVREARDGLETLTRGSRGGWFRVRFVQETAAPHRIVGLQVLPAEAPSDATAADPEQVELPDSPAGRAVAAWIEAFNSAEEGAIAAFERRYRNAAGQGAEPPEAREQRLRPIREQLGRLSVHQVLEERADGLTVLAFSADGGNWLRMDARMDERDATKIASLRLESAEPPELASQAPSRFDDLRDLLLQVRGERAIPALAAAWVVGDRIVDRAAVGSRRAGGPDDVTVEDHFHIGSVTKSLTATAIARRIARGDLAWNTTLGETFAEAIPPTSALRRVSVEQLLAHLGRVAAYTQIDETTMTELHALDGTPREQRASFARRIFGEAPRSPGHAYSNAGYAVVAALAEARTNTSWEDLLRLEVFEPLGLASASFGWPASQGTNEATSPVQPVGHFGDGVSLRPQEPGEYSLPAVLAPAGDVTMNVLDLARYAKAHLAGLKGGDGPLDTALVRRLHTPPEGFPAGATPYAGGWVLDEAPGGGPMHWHNGSAGTFYAFVGILPEDDAAFVLVANAGPRDAEPVALTALRSLLSRHRAPKAAPEGAGGAEAASETGAEVGDRSKANDTETGDTETGDTETGDGE